MTDEETEGVKLLTEVEEIVVTLRLILLDSTYKSFPEVSANPTTLST